MTDHDDRSSEVEQAAIRLLASREHTRTELRRKLAAKGDAEIVDTVLDNLVEQNLQSDDRFIEQYIQSRQRKGFGPIRIRHELKEKGANAELIGDWLDERDPVWLKTLQEAYRRKFGDRPPEDLKAKAKVSRFLEYRGFASEQIRRFLHKGDFFTE